MKASITINKLPRIWLTGVVIYVLFQYRFVQIFTALNINLTAFLNRIDEFTIIVFLPIALIKLLKHKGQHRLYLILSLPIAGLVLTGIVSGIMNDNPLKITLLGIFSYIKFFLVIFIYSSFFTEKGDFSKLYRYFLVITIVLISIAFIQELWTLYSRYILDKGIKNREIYLFSFISKRLGDVNIEEIGNWRWNIYRTPSILSHYNLFGLFCLFVLSIYIFFKVKRSLPLTVFLIFGVLLSVSKVACMGLIFVMLARIIDKRKWYVILSIIFISLTLILSIKTGKEISEAEMQKGGSYLLMQKKLTFREYANYVSFQVWKDYPLFGTGPGMFGGDVAYKYRSPVYEEYNFHEIYRHVKSLDQLWPQLFAEIGLVGGVVFLELIMTIFILLLMREKSENEYGFSRALGAYTVVFLLYTLGDNLNNPALLYPYCAFLGVYFRE